MCCTSRCKRTECCCCDEQRNRFDNVISSFVNLIGRQDTAEALFHQSVCAVAFFFSLIPICSLHTSTSSVQQRRWKVIWSARRDSDARVKNNNQVYGRHRVQPAHHTEHSIVFRRVKGFRVAVQSLIVNTGSPIDRKHLCLLMLYINPVLCNSCNI